MPGTQGELRVPKVPFRAPARKAVHSEWVNDNTGPPGSLEFRTSTDWPANATSTQSVLAEYLLFRHSIVDCPDPAMRHSSDQAKNDAREVVRCREMHMPKVAVPGGRLAVEVAGKAWKARPATSATHPWLRLDPMINTDPRRHLSRGV